MPTGRIFLVLMRESVGRGCGRELGEGALTLGHAPQSLVLTHTGHERNLTTHVASLVKTRSFAPPRRRLASQHHEALLLSSLCSGAGMTGSTAHHVAPSQVILNKDSREHPAFLHAVVDADGFEDMVCMV